MKHDTFAGVALLVYFVLWLFLVYSCLTSEEGIDRLTWLSVLVWIPVFGPVFYLCHAFRKLNKEG